MENSLTIEHKIAGYGEQESLNGNELGLGTYLFIAWHEVRKTRVCTIRDQPLSKKIITKINSKSIQKSEEEEQPVA